MFVKWEFNLKKLEQYCIGSDCNIYRKPYTKGGRSFSFRLIKMQYSNRWRLAGEWWHKDKLRPHICLCESKEEIYKTNELPF